MTDPEERIVEIEERLEAWPDDGALVVYAPDDIPYLLERVEELEDTIHLMYTSANDPDNVKALARTALEAEGDRDD